MKQFAYRNIRLCTKDCLCLYVCPTGATDTENSIIDVTKCTGCGDCANSCPSGAITMVPVEMPPQQEKNVEVVSVIRQVMESKGHAEAIAKKIAENTDKDGLQRLMKAIAKSSRIIAEDLSREGGYMLPQSKNTHDLLEALVANPPTKDFPSEIAEELLKLLPSNEAI